MTRTLLTAAILALLPAIGMAQSCGTEDLIDTLTSEERARLDGFVAPHPFAEGNVFEATKGDDSVVVVGTLHTPDPRFAPMVERLRPRIEAADLLVLEATSEEMGAMEAMAATNPDMFFITEGPTLIDLLTEAEWAQITDQLAELGVPGFFAAKFQPWYLSMTLAVPPCAMNMILAGENGLDMQVETIATNAGVAITSLDDLDALFAIMAGDSIEDQVADLRIMLETQQDTTLAYSTLTEAYFDGRIREGWEFMRIQIDRYDIEDGDAMFADIEAQLLDGRNAKWEAQLSDLITGKDVVIAVGAAHLSGETGVLRALERAGYEVLPL